MRARTCIPATCTSRPSLISIWEPSAVRSDATSASSCHSWHSTTLPVRQKHWESAGFGALVYTCAHSPCDTTPIRIVSHTRCNASQSGSDRPNRRQSRAPARSVSSAAPCGSSPPPSPPASARALAYACVRACTCACALACVRLRASTRHPFGLDERIGLSFRHRELITQRVRLHEQLQHTATPACWHLPGIAPLPNKRLLTRQSSLPMHSSDWDISAATFDRADRCFAVV